MEENDAISCRKKNMLQRWQKICAIYVDGIVTTRKWFARFTCGNIDRENRECSRRSAVVDDGPIEKCD